MTTTDTFYTNVQVAGKHILYRGVENGKRIARRIEYNPTLYVPSQTATAFTTIYGEHVSEVKPGNIRDCRDFVSQYENISNFKIYGNQKYEYAYISDEFRSEIHWTRNNVVVANIDIEVGSENGFPEPDTASEPITAIAIKINDKFTVFGCGDYKNTRTDVQYIRCRDEIDLIKRFIDHWTGASPDIVTGWYIKFFDIPYIINRIRNVLGEDWMKRMSPWGIIRDRSTFIQAKEYKSKIIFGCAVMDGIELYKKFSPDGTKQSSFDLNNISFVELDERKLSYAEYGSLHSLYRENFQKFIDYNIRDVELVEKILDKHKLIELAMTLAYDSKSNYEDVFAQVRMWDALIYNKLRSLGKVVPPMKDNDKDDAFDGAYVKDPVPGMYKWIASFDLNSLYPHLIMQYNISPETIIEPDRYNDALRGILSQGISVSSLLDRMPVLDALRASNVTLTPNGQFFDRSRQGFLPKMMEEMYNDRSVYKKKAQEAKKELEKETDPDKRKEIEWRIVRYNNLQLAKKVCLNSAYGATGNEFFRFFDVRQASAITAAGQLSIKWIERALNKYLNKILKTEDKDYVIASDTDSIYLDLAELVQQTIDTKNPSFDTRGIIRYLDRVCENKLQPFIDRSYKDLAGYINAYDQKMIMKREALADRGIWTAKKRYILNVYNNEGIEYAKPKIKIVGLEMIKSTVPIAVKEKLNEAVDYFMNKTEDEMLDFIEEFREEFKKLDINEISSPRGVNNLAKYQNKTDAVPIHVRASLNYNKLLVEYKLTKKYPAIKEGEKIKFIYLKEPNSFKTNVIAFSTVMPKELNIEKWIDYNLQFEKTFLKPLSVILDAIGWKSERHGTLEDLFK